jgi:tetratricopeptide (TPR) repeat protein
MSRILFERPTIGLPDISLILLDWCCRESFHMLDYLVAQDVPRERFEVVWIEYYDREAPEIREHIDRSVRDGHAPAIDRWIVMDMPRGAYYHKHLMYNLGIVAARGRIVTICDSDAMVKPSFVAAMIEAFDQDGDIALHLDEVRNVSRQFYPFNYPSFEDVTGEGAINWKDGKTTGLWEEEDPLHVLNYGACFCARRDDLIRIGGADEHVDYLGHICGPYELTWRLVNGGRKEMWHPTEFLYHTWHPGTDGDENYLGPHDGRNVSTTALAARRQGRVLPLVENPAVSRLRTAPPSLPPLPLPELLRAAIGERRLDDWKIDETKRLISSGRAAYGRRAYSDAIEAWEQVGAAVAEDPSLLSDLAWAYYFVERWEEAKAAFDCSLAIGGRNPHAFRGRGWSFLQLGRHEDARGDFTAAIDELGTFEAQALQEALRGRGWTSFHMGRYPDAIADLERALEGTNEQNHGARQDLHRALGWSFLKIGDARGAEAHFAAALGHIDPNDRAVFADASNGLAQARESVAAAPAPAFVAAKPLQAEPPAAPLARAAAQAPRAPEQQPRSESSTGMAAATSGQIRGELAATLAWAYYRRAMYDDALALFEQAIASDPGNVQARSGRGWTMLQRGQAAAARRDFDVAVDRCAAADRLQEVLRGRGWARYHLRDYRGALEDFTRALEYAAPDDRAAREDLLRGRIRCAYRLRRYDLAAIDVGQRHGREGRPVSPKRSAIAADIYASAIRWRLAKMRSALWRT